jgi:hypothetical protein
LIRITLKKEHIWYFKIGMLLFTIPCAFDVYDILNTGVVHSTQFKYVRGDHWGYYAYLSKSSGYLFLFLWVATFGSKVKPTE